MLEYLESENELLPFFKIALVIGLELGFIFWKCASGLNAVAIGELSEESTSLLAVFGRTCLLVDGDAKSLESQNETYAFHLVPL
jgi:hypothetical protein